MLWKLFLAFTLIPIAELALLIELGSRIGTAATLSIIVGTALLGSVLVKHEGLRTLREIKRQTTAGQLPARQMVEGLLILVAGAFLLTPGIITDALGFFLLIPPCRALVVRRLRRWLERHINVLPRDVDARIIASRPLQPEEGSGEVGRAAPAAEDAATRGRGDAER